MIGALGGRLLEVGAAVAGLSSKLFTDGFGLRLAILAHNGLVKPG